MSGGNCQTDRDGRRHHVTSVCVIAYRVDDQNQNKGYECFHDEPLVRLYHDVDSRLTKTLGHPVRSYELE